MKQYLNLIQVRVYRDSNDGPLKLAKVGTTAEVYMLKPVVCLYFLVDRPLTCILLFYDILLLTYSIV